MDYDYIHEATIEEIKRFLTFKNSNNFDEYHAMVLPKTKSVLYSDKVSSNSKKNSRKNPNPMKVNLKEIERSIEEFEISDSEIDKNLIKNKDQQMKNRDNDNSKINLINNKKRNSNKGLKNKNDYILPISSESDLVKAKKSHINHDSFLKNYHGEKFDLVKLTAKKTSKLDDSDIQKIKNEQILNEKIINSLAPKESKIIDNLKSTKIFTLKENEISPNSKKDYPNEFNNSNDNNFSKNDNNSHIKEINKNEKCISKLDRLTNMKNNAIFGFDYKRNENDIIKELTHINKNFICKKRNREKNSSKSLSIFNSDDLNNVKKNSHRVNTDKKTTKHNNLIKEMEIDEETKDNSNNNELSNNYNRCSKNNYNIYGNDFENIERINGINCKNTKNQELSDDENFNYTKNKLKIDLNIYENNKIENLLNSNNAASAKRKRKKESTNSLNFSLNKEVCENFSDIELNEKEDESCSNCFICGWRYPREMDLKDKNEHVNFCADGEGEKHKKIYASSQRLIKIAINSQDEENISNNHETKINNDNNKKDKLTNYCYICSKRIYLRNGKTIDEHILKCYKEKEEKIFTKNQKIQK